jgi:hypothetical protein
MTEIVRETITTEGNILNPTIENTTNNDATSYQTAEYLIYFIFGVLEVLLIFRFILKFMGASSSSAFVGLIYSLTGIFILPFEGIFSKWFSRGIETRSVIESSTLIAIIVYAVLVIGIVKLIRIFSGKRQQITD